MYGSDRIEQNWWMPNDASKIVSRRRGYESTWCAKYGRGPIEERQRN
jgi:hypothetical protein